MSRSLFPPDGLAAKPEGYGLTRGRHSFGFSVDFPVLSDCLEPHQGIRQPETTLPSSFRLRTPVVDVDVSYLLSVTVQGAGKWKNSQTVERELRFIFVDPPPPDVPSEWEARRAVGSLAFEAFGLEVPCASPSNSSSDTSGGSEPNLAREVLPDYTPALFLEATVPDFGVVKAGSKLGLDLKITVPISLFDSLGTIGLQSLRVSLCGSLVASMASLKPHSCSMRVVLVDLRLALALCRPVRTCHNIVEFDIADALWRGLTIPDVAPTVRCCAMAYEYTLQIEAGISSLGNAQRCQVYIPVSFCLSPSSGSSLSTGLKR